jgi:tetratricopeptide (TPR) repeat protein
LSTGTFVGRDQELAEMLRSLDAAESGQGRLVLLGGEPGIGKTRLADELTIRAADRGDLVLWGRAWEDAGAPAYWPWVQAVRAYVRSAPIDDVRRDVGTGAVDVAQMLPELRDMLPEVPDPPDRSSDSARFQLFDSTARLFRNLASRRPALVVLDDLHAADTPSILLLRFLAGQLSDMAMLVVGTYRDVELTPDHPMTTAIAEMSRERSTRVVQVSGLAVSAVDEFIRSTAGIESHGRLASAVWRATNGNPLFVGEAVRLLSAEGRLSEVADLSSLRMAVPPGIRAVIARRVGHLSDPSAAALRLGALIGPEFEVEVVGKVGSYDQDQVLDVIDEATEAGLLAPVAGTAGRYRFSHDLVRETLYDEVPRGRRARLHGRVADVLEELSTNSPRVHLAELAHHFVMASLGGDVAPSGVDAELVASKAIGYAMRAGDEASLARAYEEGARLYRMALSVLDLGHGDENARLGALLALGDVTTRAGDLDAGRGAFLEAADIARRTGSGQHLARAALGLGGRHIWARAGNDERIVPLLQDALVMLGGDDDRLRARLLARLACAWRSAVERRDDSAALSRQAVEIARGLDDRATLSHVLVGRFWATWWPENPDDRVAIAREALDVAEASGDGERLVDAHILGLMTQMERGRVAEARDKLAILERLIEELRQPAHLWLYWAARALQALMAGDFAAAEGWIARQLGSPHHVTPARDGLTAARAQRFLLRREQGRVAEEEATLRASVADFPWYPFHQAALVCLLLDLGQTAEARSVFDRLGQGGFSALYPDNEWLFGMGLASEACARLGDVAAAAILYERLGPYAGRHAIGLAEGSLGAVDRYLGLLAATSGDLDAAASHLEAAIIGNEQMGARSWVAHCQHDLADVLRRRGDAGDGKHADELEHAARATALDLGMALADRIGLPVDDPGTAVVGRAVTIATFRREGEYWSVAFDGDPFRVRDSKGMRHLAKLLASPGSEVHALELVDLRSSGSVRATLGDDLMSANLGDAGPLLDTTTKAAYRERLQDIRRELVEAEEWNDPERVARLQVEERALVHELSAALGLGGRDRAAASASERARVSVTRAIRSALDRIGRQDPTLGDHFEATIRTGTFCSYVPDPRIPITWRL